jgi:broad specificity phosphatase PhoE
MSAISTILFLHNLIKQIQRRARSNTRGLVSTHRYFIKLVGTYFTERLLIYRFEVNKNIGGKLANLTILDTGGQEEYSQLALGTILLFTSYHCR